MTVTTAESVRPVRERRAGPAGLDSLRRAAPVAAMYAVSIAVALALCGLLVAVTGGSATKVFSALLDGSVRSPGAWGLTLTTATPLLVVAVGAIVSNKAGMTSIGQEGQVLLGCAGTAFVATRLVAPGPVVIVVSLAAGVALGALWALLAAVMRFTRSVPEVISTLLLTFIAVQITTFCLTKQWLLLSRSNTSRTNVGEPFKSNARMPGFTVFGNTITWGAAVAVVVAVAVGLVITRTGTGFRLRMLGLNQRTARRAGVSAAVVGGGALVFSGAAAGLAGGLWLSGGAAGDRFTTGISSNIGWQGLLVALLAREKAILAVPMAFLFAALRTGSGFLSATGVDRRIADVVQAMLVLALLVPPAVQAIQRRRHGGAA